MWQTDNNVQVIGIPRANVTCLLMSQSLVKTDGILSTKCHPFAALWYDFVSYDSIGHRQAQEFN